MAIDAHGTLIKRNGVTIGELRAITMPALTRNTFEVTSQTDDDDVSVVGHRRKGELSFGINFMPSGQITHGFASGLVKAWSTKTLDLYQGVYPDGSTWACSGYVVGITPKAPVEGELAADVSIKLSGAFVFTGM